VLSGALALADIEAGRSDDARRRLQAFADAGFDLEMNPVWVSGMAFHAEAAIEIRDPAFCGPIYERLLPWSDQWTDNGATAACPIAHYLGGCAAVLQRHDEADDWFAQAANMCDSAGAKFFRAQTDLLWGRMLAARGVRDDLVLARELLEQARTAASAQGYGAVQERAETALSRLG
jgi:hypothetical protein